MDMRFLSFGTSLAAAVVFSGMAIGQAIDIDTRRTVLGRVAEQIETRYHTADRSEEIAAEIRVWATDDRFSQSGDIQAFTDAVSDALDI
jgi:hypothetical protein